MNPVELQKYLSPSVDLVILDNFLGHALGEGMEHVLLGLERLGNGTMPAVLFWSSAQLFEYEYFCVSRANSNPNACQEHPCNTTGLITLDGKHALDMHDDDVHRLAQWYGLSALSWRSLLLGLDRDGAKGTMNECEFAQHLHRDGHHPNILGQALMADAIINVMVHAQNHLENHPTHKPPGKPASTLYVQPNTRGVVQVTVADRYYKLWDATAPGANYSLHLLNNTGWRFTHFQVGMQL
ncbi:hypothetical protein HXX76_009481 [Chlamydomonas incerta]|uniref:Uncharacterized protein n=1 Tax=Chlamydomonas incerta TaxID=51695 RepID=A0A835SQI2_CHLIN|nr:hypothetical protein HXX76_009481 [Chlamydomonas incerta]|eukprot:KAG2431467.1 hypothetical protein HXX76_009481 [Chlamydomonas incerta]